MEQVSRFQFRSFIGDPLRINKQRKGDACFFAKNKCVMHVAKPNHRQGSPGSLEFGLVVAQLRDMLAAKNSPVVAEEDENGGIPFPQSAEPHFVARCLGQHNIRETRADRCCHVHCCLNLMVAVGPEPTTHE